MNYGRDLTISYDSMSDEYIIYTVCRDFNHISRYRNLRQIVHSPDTLDRCVTLETPNAFVTHTEIRYHEVTVNEINRLDLIADKELGSATYSWVIAYFNNIEDGYTVREGQKLKIPDKGVTSLLNTGEFLAPITATRLNLGEE